jgi:hypothetical protein
MPHRLDELGSQHHAAIRMRLEGASTEEICECLEVEKRTVYIWFGDPLVKAELKRQLERINELFAERLASGAVSALEELKRMAEMPVQGQLTPDTKLKVLKELLDRATAQRRLPEGESIFSEMSDHELVEKARRMIPPEANGGSPGSA